MKDVRCPYKVKQGIVDEEGKLILTEICSVKTASGALCTQHSIEENDYKQCHRFSAQKIGTDKQVLIPKNDIEYVQEYGNSGDFSELNVGLDASY